MFRNPLADAVIVLVIVLLFVGPKKLPALGKGLGQGMREFKEGITGQSKPDDDKPALNQATAMPGAGVQPGAAAATSQQPAAAPQAAAGSAPADSQRPA
jgi:sec-independent protein translocase protein TatA